MEAPKTKFARYYTASDLAKNNESTTKDLARPGSGTEALKISFKNAHASNVFLQFSEIFKREFMSSWRNPELQPIRLLIGLIVSLYFGLFYLNISTSTQSGVFGALAFIMSSAGFIAVVVLLSSLPMLFESRNVFYRERTAGYYLPIAYSMGLFFAELPWIALLTLILSPISYFMAGYQNIVQTTYVSLAAAYFTFWFGNFLLAVSLFNIGTFFTAWLPNVILANILGGLMINLSFLFSGIFIPINGMLGPNNTLGWGFLYYLTSSAQALRMQSLPQFYCDTSVPGCPTFPLLVNGPTGPVVVQTYVYNFVSGLLGTGYGTQWQSFGWLILIIAFFRTLAIVCYWRIDHTKR
jgi:hypothetical protein